MKVYVIRDKDTNEIPTISLMTECLAVYKTKAGAESFFHSPYIIDDKKYLISREKIKNNNSNKNPKGLISTISDGKAYDLILGVLSRLFGTAKDNIKSCLEEEPNINFLTQQVLKDTRSLMLLLGLYNYYFFFYDYNRGDLGVINELVLPNNDKLELEVEVLAFYTIGKLRQKEKIEL